VTDQTAPATQLITTDELPESVVEAVNAYGERYGMTDLVASATMVARTSSSTTRRRLLWRSRSSSDSYTLLTPAGLVVVAADGVTGWRLAGSEVLRVTGGLHLTGLRFGSAVRETTLVHLATDDEGAAFEAALVIAVTP
jgi:hypothetical protein